MRFCEPSPAADRPTTAALLRRQVRSVRAKRCLEAVLTESHWPDARAVAVVHNGIDVVLDPDDPDADLFDAWDWEDDE